MTARDVIAEMRAECGTLRAKDYGSDAVTCAVLILCDAMEGYADRLESTLAHSGEAVAWQRRWEGSGPQRGWHIVEAKRLHNNNTVAYLGDGIAEAEVDAIVEAHNAALYTTPPAPLGGLTEGDVEKLRSENYTLKLRAQDDALLIEELESRLTAPRAEGVDRGPAWTDADAAKPWGCEVAALRHMADDPALNTEQAAMLRHCAKRIETCAAPRDADRQTVADFVALAREAKPVGQWPGELVLGAIERIAAVPAALTAAAPKENGNGR